MNEAPQHFENHRRMTKMLRSLLALRSIAVLIFALANVPAAVAAESTPLANPADNRPYIYATSVPFGAYDSPGDFSKDPLPQIEHLFMPWLDVDMSFLDVADSYALAKRRDILITIEPWTWSQPEKTSPEDLYNGIMEGHYDQVIASVCGKFAKYRSKVVVRWAQEMEDKTGRFIWADWKPEKYQSAYRHFVTKCRASAGKLHFMWSPKGLPNLRQYYPGNDVVDIVGLSVFGYQPYDRGEFGRDRGFADILTPGYTEAAKLGKPIWVAELGYSGNAQYVARWQADVMKVYPQFPMLKAVVYFNDKEVWPWPKNYGLPDWIVRENITNIVLGANFPVQ